MKTLTLFIMRSGNKEAEASKVTESLHYESKEENREYVFYPTVVKVIDSLSEIQAVETSHYMVMWDNEVASEALASSIHPFMYYDADVFVMFKREKNLTTTRSPRMFKDHVKLQHETLLPVDAGYGYETILDGFILEQEC